MFSVGFDAEWDKGQLLKAGRGAGSSKAELPLWNRLIGMNRLQRASHKPHASGSLLGLESEEEPLLEAADSSPAPLELCAEPRAALPAYRWAPSCWGAPQYPVPPLSARGAGRRHPLAAPGGTVSLQTVPSRAKAPGLPRTRVGPRRVPAPGCGEQGTAGKGRIEGHGWMHLGHAGFMACLVWPWRQAHFPPNSWPKWDSHPAAVSPLRSTEHPRLHPPRHSLVELARM
ncbi:uncharacterized protein LOC118178655 [Oxyura jamaicensis]|uniref:uncharacterized protein LOC118178655 n=1 Tax=Oxyura jamaicensis TaxID=8884 RepID=UPI0015A4FACF|nr:uncharacterized protein LOC118178655 [Oxyura jamaicensis]